MITLEIINIIQAALDKGLRIELLKTKTGDIIVQTISRKRLN